MGVFNWMAGLVVSIFKKSQEDYTKKHRNGVISILNSIKQVITSQPSNKHFHIHVLTAVLLHIIKMIIESKYYDRPEIIIKNIVNKALDEKDRPLL
jgi:hypothetical protein